MLVAALYYEIMKKKEWVKERLNRGYCFGKISRKTYEEKTGSTFSYNI